MQLLVLIALSSLLVSAQATIDAQHLKIINQIHQLYQPQNEVFKNKLSQQFADSIFPHLKNIQGADAEHIGLLIVELSTMPDNNLKLLKYFQLTELLKPNNTYHYIAFSQHGLLLAQKLHFTQACIAFHENIGTGFMALHGYENAILEFEKALQLAHKLSKPSYTISVLNNLCAAHGYLSNYKKAVTYGIQSIKLSEQIKDTTQLAHTLINVGVAYATVRDFTNAAYYFQNAINHTQHTNKKI